MQTSSLVPSGTSLAQSGGLPPLVLDNVSNTDLKALCQEMYSDLGFLAGIIPERFGPIVSTGVTGITAAIAGGIDGALGKENKIGPVPINTAAAVMFAAGAVFGPNGDIREGCAAAARGFGAPLVYQWSQAKAAAWAAQRAAAKAAIAGAAATPAPASS
jgi:hypothetical protein